MNYHSWKETYKPSYSNENRAENFNPLTLLWHIAHINTAVRILHDGACKASLVFDEESRLFNSRTLVTWLSPNYWTDGSRYGNVAFKIPFEKIICGKKYYWVETRNYNAIAHRFLITSLDHPELTIYDPVADTGPWRFDPAAQVHYWDSKETLEFMLEENIPVSDFMQIETFKHHEHQCCVDTVNCGDKSTDSQDSAALFIAKVIAADVAVQPRHFTRLLPEGRYPNAILLFAMGKFKEVIIAMPPADPAWLAAADPLAEFYIKAALHFLKPYHPAGFNAIAQSFLSKKDCFEALARVMVKKFALADASSLGRFD